jgi:hypothetical protein
MLERLSAFCSQLSLRGGCFLLSALCFPSVASLPSLSRFEVQGSKFGVFHKPSEYNSPPPPPSGWSGGTLDKPWTSSGTIEPSQSLVSDQPSLSRPLSGGIPAAERFRCGAALWSAGARSLRLCTAIVEIVRRLRGILAPPRRTDRIMAGQNHKQKIHTATPIVLSQP